jgi:hypothetical protein
MKRDKLLWLALLFVLPSSGFAKPQVGSKASARALYCLKDADCVALPSVCPSCGPCKPTWRRIGNRKEARRLRKLRTLAKCPRYKCRPCASAMNWRGHRPVCRAKRCRWAARLGPPKRPWSKRRVCKKNSDCVFARRSPCACVPCWRWWRSAWNRQADKHFQSVWARRRCKRRKCPRCKSIPLGDKVLCINGQCTVR